MALNALNEHLQAQALSAKTSTVLHSHLKEALADLLNEHLQQKALVTELRAKVDSLTKELEEYRSKAATS